MLYPLPLMFPCYDNSIESVSVSLVDAEGKVKMHEKSKLHTDVAGLVTDAQSKAIRISCKNESKNQFVDDHTVIIKVTGPDEPNVTLVDLPGFHTDDDQDTETVNRMVERYIQMEGTLVLHVIKGDQDYGGLLGNDFMRRHTSVQRVTVLTHCDKLINDLKGRTVLANTLDKTSVNSSQTFAIHGGIPNSDPATEVEEETKALAHLEAMDERLEIGVGNLAEHLQHRMQFHLETQFPKAKAKLQASLQSTNERLALIEERPSCDLLYQLCQQIQQNYKEKKLSPVNAFRRVGNQMCLDIRSHGIQPIYATSDIPTRDEFDEDYEVGSKVYVQEEWALKFVTITKIDKTHVFWANLEDGKSDSNRALKECVRGQDSSSNSILQDITLFTEKRGMRNLVHCDRQPIIQAFSRQFADYYSDIMQKAKETVLKMVNEQFDVAFSNGVSETVRKAADKLRENMGGVIDQLEAEADEIIQVYIHTMSCNAT